MSHGKDASGLPSFRHALLEGPYEGPSIVGIFDGRLWLLKKIQLVRSFVRYRERRSERENDTQADRGTKDEGLQEGGS